MKKGFTLVEIIISITLILIIGTSVTIIVVKNNNEDMLESINKSILNAAHVYVSAKTDKNGNNFLKEIYKGKKGLEIPVSTLVSEGLVDDNGVNTLYDVVGEPSVGSDYYVLLLANGDYCNNSEIEYILSWTTDNDEPTYLCENGSFSSDSSQLELTYKLINEYSSVAILNDEEFEHYYYYDYGIGIDEIVPFDEYYIYYNGNLAVFSENIDDSSTTYATRETLFIEPTYDGLKWDSSNDYFYYIGTVDDNYLVINGDVWRILGIYPFANKLRLVKEENINSSNTTITSYSILNNILEEYRDTNLDESIEIGVMNSYDVEHAGVYNGGSTFSISGVDVSSFKTYYESEADKLCNPFFDGSGDACFLSYYSNSFLSSGDSTLYSNDASSLLLYLVSDYYNAVGFLQKASVSLAGNEYLIDKNSIRPVIEIVVDGVEYSGTGTKNNPYVIELSDLLNENA